MNKSLVTLLAFLFAAAASADSAVEYASCEDGSKALYECAATPTTSNERVNEALSIVNAFSLCEYADTPDEVVVFARSSKSESYELFTDVIRTEDSNLYYASTAGTNFKFVLGPSTGNKQYTDVNVLFSTPSSTGVQVKFTCKKTSN